MLTSESFDHFGKKVVLGSLLRRGGEGSVYDVAGQPTLVAKLYEKPPNQEKVAKLASMIAMRSPALTRIAAWPVTTLHDRPNGKLCGFVMPKIVGYREIHKLYGPSHRQREFPDADWTFLVRTAANCAAAFDTIHNLKHLMGDVNPNNVLISTKALIALIDCDSFQIQSTSQTFRCEVGVAEYTPPELQGAVFRDVTRTENHDRFGLAVLIFHLLFMGRHPFAGRYRGPGEMSLDRAIRECRFPFSLNSGTRREMEPPPLAPSMDIIAVDVANLFERAFRDSGQSARPSAGEWHTSLSNFATQLVACRRERAHKYANQPVTCPWCRFEDGTPPVIFFVSQTASLDFVSSLADLAPILAELQKVSGFARSIQSSSPVPIHPAPLPPSAVSELKRAKVAQMSMAIFGLVVLTGLVVLVFMPLGLPVIVGGAAGASISGGSWLFLARWSPFGREPQPEKMTLRQARATQEQRVIAWQEAADRSSQTQSETRTQIDTLCGEYREMKAKFDLDVIKLEESKKDAQRRDYLRGEFIADAVIKGVGSNVKSTLLSEGIETALDVLTHSLERISGVGEKRRMALTTWAQDLDRGFQFDPKKDVPIVERRAIVAKYRQRQRKIKDDIERQVSDLRQLAQAVAGSIERAHDALTTATTELAQAQADWAIVE